MKTLAVLGGHIAVPGAGPLNPLSSRQFPLLPRLLKPPFSFPPPHA